MSQPSREEYNTLKTQYDQLLEKHQNDTIKIKQKEQALNVPSHQCSSNYRPSRLSIKHKSNSYKHSSPSCRHKSQTNNSRKQQIQYGTRE